MLMNAEGIGVVERPGLPHETHVDQGFDGTPLMIPIVAIVSTAIRDAPAEL